MNRPLIVARGLHKAYGQGTSQLEVLKGIDLTVEHGEAICVRGASGAGKSTLLHILGTLDRPDRGDIIFDGEPLAKLSDEQLATFRNRSMGFVFQFHHLLLEFSALENVMMPLRIAGAPKYAAMDRAMKLLNELGLGDRVHHYPTELSGGEQQRVAVARALVQEPKVLFADEPTGNLDTANATLIQNLFFDLQKKKGLSLIVVSHDMDFAARFPRQLTLKDGRWSDALST